MKIAYLAATVIPSRTANSIHIMKMCQAFAQLGHDTWLSARVVPSQKHDVFDYYGIKTKFSVLQKPQVGAVRLSPHVSALISVLRILPIKPDFVIARDLRGAYFSSFLGVTTCFEIHGLVWESGKSKLRLFRNMLHHKGFRALVVITRTLKEQYESHFPELCGKILVLPDGADPLDGRQAASPGIAVPGRTNVGYIGHLYKGKGMEIISKVAGLCPNAHFHIVGGKEEDLNWWKGQMRDVQNVTFYGFKPHSSIPGFLNDFDIVLLPNQTEVRANAGAEIGHWTSPLKLFEYMAAGKPIICSDLPVLREVVRHGENAHLCPSDKPELWAEAIETIAGDKAYAKKLSIQARHELETQYTWAIRAERLIKHYLTFK